MIPRPPLKDGIITPCPEEEPRKAVEGVNHLTDHRLRDANGDARPHTWAVRFLGAVSFF
jgi:hypothetical protein